MEASKKLAHILEEKVQALVHKYQSLQSENEMLREELSHTKMRLQEKEQTLQTLSQSSMDEQQLLEIIATLETALENH